MKAVAWVGQGLTWAGLAAIVGALGQGPEFAPYDEERALLRVSMAHLSQRLAPCRELSEDERAELPPTRRVREVCERGRAPTRLVLEIDHDTRIDTVIEPAGLSGDGRSYFMTSFQVEPGRHRLGARMADSPDPEGFDIEREFDLEVAAGEVALVEAGDDGITLQRLQAREVP
ncbi:MAG: hypothetical protein ACOCSR_00725 [Wenzhouxiangella sp.]